MKESYRLGIDMGATSIGWCMLRLNKDKEPCGIINLGVRIFPDGRNDKRKEPLSVARRNFRSIRRNHDRYQVRMSQLFQALQQQGILPADKAELDKVFLTDPLLLRSQALDREVSLPEFARAIIHLARRRGFLSNRKTDKENKTAYDFAIQNLQKGLAETQSRTLGEYLWKKNASLSLSQHVCKQATKFRYDKKAYAETDLIFPTRALVINEFDLLWDKQASFHKELTTEAKAEIARIIFYQRPLRSQDKGKCLFEPGETRCSKANPYFQEFRILQEINNLKLIHAHTNTEFDLDREQREVIFGLLDAKQEVSFEAIRKKLYAKDNYQNFRFNLETETRTKLKGNETNYLISRHPALKAIWDSHTLLQRAETVELIDSDAADEFIKAALSGLGYPDECLDELINLHFPPITGNLSSKAIAKILPFLKQGHTYDKACLAAGYQHSGTYNGEVFTEGDLPYYGQLLKREVLPLSRISHDSDADEHGKINNPTVHIALNQLRKIINALSHRYGAPEQIALELAREVSLSTEKNKEINSLIKKNTEYNEKVAALLSTYGVENTRDNRTKYKLWEELSDNPLKRCCVYCGRMISQAELFHPQIQIEHILPRSRTFDDGINNKTISHLSCNVYKKEQSPYEAFGQSRDDYSWAAIVERVKSLPHSKQKKFQTNAMERYQDENQILARMLNDTRYMTRIAHDYLQYVVGDRAVWTVNGQLTKALRDKWRLNTILSETNTKDRTDHRQHAIDAFAIAIADRFVVKRFADSMKRSREFEHQSLLAPYPGFCKEDLAQCVQQIMVSFKPDHVNPALLTGRMQSGGALMKETAYGYAGIDPQDSKFHLYTSRTLISSLTIKDLATIKAPDLRAEVLERISGITGEKEIKEIVADWAKKRGIKKIKLLFKANPRTMIPIRDKQGKIYKYFSSDENLYADIYHPRPFDPASKWQIEICNSYWLHQPDFVPQWKQDYPMGKLIMRVYKNDIIAYTNNIGNREIRRLKKMTNNMLYLREIYSAKKPKGTDDTGEAFVVNSLQTNLACKAGVDILGRYFDPKAENS